MKAALVEVACSAIDRLVPARVEHGRVRATFGFNRRENLESEIRADMERLGREELIWLSHNGIGDQGGAEATMKVMKCSTGTDILNKPPPCRAPRADDESVDVLLVRSIGLATSASSCSSAPSSRHRLTAVRYACYGTTLDICAYQ